MKVCTKLSTALFPCPVVMVSCIGLSGKPNIITLAWVGTVCSNPPMVGIGINPKRYSFRLIEETGEFVVNIPTKSIVKEVDFCGTVSGREVDKFTETRLTPYPSIKVRPPLIQECPINMECVLRNRILLGSHQLFIGEVILVHADENILDERGDINNTKIVPIAYNRREYWNLGERIGVHGFSKKPYDSSS